MTDTLYLTPASMNITAYQGDPFAMKVTVTDPSETPIPLTGYTAAMHVRTDVADLAVSPSATATVTITDAVNGEVEAVIDKAAMAGLAGTYLYDLQIVDASGQPQTLLAGSFTVRQEVTR